MDGKRVWEVDPEGQVDTTPSFWRTTKWGQVLSFGSGALVLFYALFGSGYSAETQRIKIAGMLFALGIAFRVIDAFRPRR